MKINKLIKRKKRIKTVLEIIFFSFVLSSALFIKNSYVHADSIKDWDPGGIKNIGFITGEGKTAVEKINWFINKKIIPSARYVLVSIAVAFVVFYGLRLVTSSGDEETIEQQKKNLTFGAIGFAAIGIASVLSKAIDPAANSYRQKIGSVEGWENAALKIVTFIQYIAGSICMLLIIIGAIRMITAEGDTERIDRQKKNFTWGFMGLIVIMTSDVLVNKMIYPKIYGETRGTTPGEVRETAKEVSGLIMFILQYIGALAVLSAIIAGIYYLTAVGNEEREKKAKNILIGTLVGIVLIIGAYAIIATITGSK